MIKTTLRRDWLKEHWFIIVLLIAALVIALYTAYFLMTHHKVPDTPRYQLTPQAMQNRLFVAQQLLTQQDKAVHLTKGEVAHQGLKQVWQQPASNAKHSAVVLLTVSQSQKPDIEAMLRWVERGGHLITFSNETLRDPDNSNDSDTTIDRDEALSRYWLNENALLHFLQIRSVQTQDPHEMMQNILNLNVQAPSSDTQSPVTPSGIRLATKALLRLPAITHEGGIIPDKYVGVIINTDHTRHLQSEAFFQRYPNAKPIADYNWFNPDIAQGEQTIRLLPMQNIADNQPAQALSATLRTDVQHYLPADEALLDVHWGQGRLTVLNHDAMFNNPSADDLPPKSSTSLWQTLNEKPAYPPSVANFDNAYLLQYLLAGRDQVWLVPDIEVASLPTLLWRHLKWATLAFGIATLAALLAMPRRFGRMRVYQTDTQTNIFGYFNHVGQYLWHSDQGRALVQDNRERLIERIVARHPAVMTQPQAADIWQRVDKAILCERVSDETGISRGAVALALFEDWQTERGFLHMSRAFAQLNQYYHLT